MGWKERLGELRGLARQERQAEKEKKPKRPEFSRQTITPRVQKVIREFARHIDWDISNDGRGSRAPSTFQVRPKAKGEESWRCLESQIVVKINSHREQVEITPPPALTRGGLSRPRLLPFSEVSEEELADILEDFYLLLCTGDREEDSSVSVIEDVDPGSAFQLGWYYSEDKDEFQMAKIAEEDRATHLYTIGATGTGKTKFIEFLIQQDIERGNGFGVIDPHGDLIEDIKGFLVCRYDEYGDDKELIDRVVLIDPTDPNFTVTFNPLERLPNVSVAEQVGELISSFKKIWSGSWGVRMEDLLRNSLIALGEAELPLTELPRFLTDRSFRENVLRRVENPLASDYFARRFNVLTDRGQLPFIEPVMNKINAFLADPRIRQMFSSNKSSFNLREIIDRRKILLVKLDKGRLKGSADLLGSLLMAKIQMAAFSRSDLPQGRRTPFHLYIDEFQNFASESFMVVLSEARKYGLSLVMAHQTLAQIPEELKSLILGNAGIQVYFRVNRRDAQLLAKEAFEYSGYEVKTFHSAHPVFWTLGEEWEHKTEELQKLPPRCCYAKHKIEGGLIPLITAEVAPARKVLGLEESEYQEYLESLPLGRKYLVPRDKLLAAAPAYLTPAKEKVEAETAEEVKPVEVTPPRSSEEIEELERKEPALPSKEAAEAVPSAPKGERERQHRYLQSLLKHVAEEYGYRAIIEEPTPDGGRVDVGLEQDGRRIACEISVTSTGEQEISNIEKCLRASYDRIIVCCSEKRPLEKIKSMAIERFEQPEQEKLLFLHPEDLFSHLEADSAALAGSEERVKGYKVKVNYQPLEEDEQLAKREAVAQVILQSLKRQKEK